MVDLTSGEPLGPHQEGEYCMKGPQVMKGYFNNQAATDEMITSDGWLHTGKIRICIKREKSFLACFWSLQRCYFLYHNGIVECKRIIGRNTIL